MQSKSVSSNPTKTTTPLLSPSTPSRVIDLSASTITASGSNSSSRVLKYPSVVLQTPNKSPTSSASSSPEHLTLSAMTTSPSFTATVEPGSRSQTLPWWFREEVAQLHRHMLLEGWVPQASMELNFLFRILNKSLTKVRNKLKQEVMQWCQ
jgi:hypothetical protein